MRRLIYIIAFLIICSCNDKDYTELQGHWHSNNSKDCEYYQTLDIKDSLVIFNKYNRNGYYEESALKEINGELKFNIYGLGYDLKYYFNSDTLVIEEKSGNEVLWKSKWLKHENSASDIEKDFSSYLKLNINLDYNTESIPIDSLEVHYAIINIGKLKKQFLSYKPYRRNDKYDPYYIQMKDAFASDIDVEEFLVSVLETIPENEKNGFCAIIHADKDVPNLIIENIVEKLKKITIVESIYQTCMNDEIQQICLIRL